MNGPVTDVHVHVQPWEMIRPQVLAAMRKGRDDLAEIERCFADPAALLAHMDRQGVARMVLINYESPDVMGFTTETNDWVLRYTEARRDRLLPCVGINPRFERDVRGRAERLADGGARLFKVHGPHMLVSPNDYLDRHPALADLYEVASRAPHPRDVPHRHEHLQGRADEARRSAPARGRRHRLPRTRRRSSRTAGGRSGPSRRSSCCAASPASISTCRASRRAASSSGSRASTRSQDRVFFGTDWPSPGIPSIAKNLAAVRALPLAPEIDREVPLVERAPGLPSGTLIPPGR